MKKKGKRESLLSEEPIRCAVCGKEIYNIDGCYACGVGKDEASGKSKMKP